MSISIDQQLALVNSNPDSTEAERIAQLRSAIDPATILSEHQAVAQQLKELQEKERFLRSAVCDIYFPATARKMGTNNFNLGSGYKLKAVFKQNFRLAREATNPDTGEIFKLGDALTQIAEHSADGPFIVDRLVKFNPELSKTEYDRLSSEQRAYLAGVLTISDATPSVELVEPKSK